MNIISDKSARSWRANSKTISSSFQQVNGTVTQTVVPTVAPS
jgi:hypothetical protein